MNLRSPLFVLAALLVGTPAAQAQFVPPNVPPGFGFGSPFGVPYYPPGDYVGSGHPFQPLLDQTAA